MVVFSLLKSICDLVDISNPPLRQNIPRARRTESPLYGGKNYRDGISLYEAFRVLSMIWPVIVGIHECLGGGNQYSYVGVLHLDGNYILTALLLNTDAFSEICVE